MMILSAFSSPAFWACYLSGGISDVLDGFLARKLQQESETGAKLDSIADFIFVVSLLIVIVENIYFPMWLWWCIAAIMLLRSISCIIGFCKYHTFSPLHTLLNKAAGTAVFMFPLLYACIGIDAAGAIVCAITFISSLEETAIILRSNELDINTKSIFSRSN